MFRKSVYPHEYMDEWRLKYERYYRCRLHACKKSLQRLWNLGEYHDFYLKSDA